MAEAPGEFRNDRANPVTRFCLSMEEHRRTEPGRVRTAREMLDFYFPRSATGAEDKIFLHIPPPVRGPIVSAWGVRGSKSAIRDTDEKTRQVVFDALAAGDIDESSFEEGIDATVLIDWSPLTEWWTFWRTGKLTGVAVQKALAVARELGLFDERWFLQNVDGRGGKLKGTDTVCDTLSKDQIVAWMRNIHESGDGSPAGLIGALGWETVLAKTSQEALLFALDALAKKIGLLGAQAVATEKPVGSEENAASPAIPALASVDIDMRGDEGSSAGESGEAPLAADRDSAKGRAPSESFDEVPVSFADLASPTTPRNEKSKAQPRPAMPSSRKNVR